MRTFQSLLLLAGLLAGQTEIHAQQVLAVNLEEAQQYAVEYNKTLKNAGLAVEAAKQSYLETRAMGFPQANATIDYTNFLGAEISFKFGEGMPAATIPFKPTSNLQLTVAQLIFNGSYIVGMQTAMIYRDLTKSGLERTGLEIKSQVAASYYTILMAERSREILNGNLENINDVFNKTRAMLAAGIAESTDVDQMAVQVTYLENAAVSADRQIELAYNLLRMLLGVDAQTQITLKDKLDDILLKINFEATMSDQFSLDENIDYKMMNTQQLLSKKQIDLQRVSYLPTISGFYNHTEKILKPDFDMTPPNMVGLQMNVPIFSSGSRRAKVHQAKINYETTLNNKSLLTDQLLIQEKQLRYNLRTGLEQYESQKKNVEVSKRVYNNINLKYQQGLVSSLDLTTANNNYLQAESGYIGALMELLNAQLALAKLLNTL
jgi:outer membrane protein TolC